MSICVVSSQSLSQTALICTSTPRTDVIRSFLLSKKIFYHYSRRKFNKERSSKNPFHARMLLLRSKMCRSTYHRTTYRTSAIEATRGVGPIVCGDSKIASLVSLGKIVWTETINTAIHQATKIQVF